MGTRVLVAAAALAVVLAAALGGWALTRPPGDAGIGDAVVVTPPPALSTASPAPTDVAAPTETPGPVDPAPPSPPDDDDDDDDEPDDDDDD